MASLATQYCVVKIDELSYLFCDNAVIVKCQHVIPCSLIEPEFASSVMGRWRSLMFTPGYEIADVGFMCRILGVAYPRVCREIGVAVIDERYFRLFPSDVHWLTAPRNPERSPLLVKNGSKLLGIVMPLKLHPDIGTELLDEATDLQLYSEEDGL